MKKNQLFQVLVIGGSLLTAGLTIQAQEETSTQVSTSQLTSISVLELPIETEDRGQLTFCEVSKPEHCEEGQPKQGIVCCWGTTCGG